MIPKIFLVAVVGLMCMGACILWDSTVSPQVESDMAIAQMDPDDGAAVGLRATSKTLAYQYPIALAVWLVVTVFVFRPEIGKGMKCLIEFLDS
jgi:hypothetical protein